MIHIRGRIAIGVNTMPQCDPLSSNNRVNGQEREQVGASPQPFIQNGEALMIEQEKSQIVVPNERNGLEVPVLTKTAEQSSPPIESGAQVQDSELEEVVSGVCEGEICANLSQAVLASSDATIAVQDDSDLIKILESEVKSIKIGNATQDSKKRDYPRTTLPLILAEIRDVTGYQCTTGVFRLLSQKQPVYQPTKHILLGKQFNLYKQQNETNKLLIYSHGGYISRPEFGCQTGVTRRIPGLGGWFKVPAEIEIYFYAPHKKSILSYSLNGVMHRINPFEKLTSGTIVRNYRLRGLGHELPPKDIMTKMDEHNIGSGSNSTDVLTVKSASLLQLVRFPTLKEIIKMLSSLNSNEDIARNYTEIYCYFCRNSLFYEEGLHDVYRENSNSNLPPIDNAETREPTRMGSVSIIEQEEEQTKL